MPRPTSLTHAQADHVRDRMRDFTAYLYRLDAALRARGHCVYRHPFAREVRRAWHACIEIGGMAQVCGSGMFGHSAIDGTITEWFGFPRDSRDREGFIDGDGI